MIRLSVLGVMVFCSMMLSGCVSMKVGMEKQPSRLQVEGIATGYAALSGIRPYDKTILKAGLFSETERDGEIASIDIWPLGGVGVGLAGGRIQLLSLDVGAGVLFYQPKPAKHSEDKSEGKKEKKEMKTEGKKKESKSEK